MLGRGYDNRGRASAALARRRRILDTAARLIIEGGYPAMTIASLAAAAEVSPQTVYNSIGGKAEVVKAVYDVTLAGDDEPIPMSQRPQFRSMAAARSTEEFLAPYAAWCRAVSERVGPLLGALSPHAHADLATFAATIDAERRTGTTHALTALFAINGRRSGTKRFQRTVDGWWTLNSPEVYERLVGRCQWKPADYERWLIEQLRAALG